MVFKFKVGSITATKSFPNQEDNTKCTSRPIVILQDLGTHVLVCPYTKQVQQAFRYKYVKHILKDTDEGRSIDIKFDSILVIDRAVKLNKNSIANIEFACCPEPLLNELLEMLNDFVKNNGPLT